MKKILIGVGVILLGVVVWYYVKHPLSAKVKIRNAVFIVDVAVTGEEKQLGLGKRSSLAPGHGMLFVYDHQFRYPFWMKGMQFPLDFIWITGNKIVDLTANVPVSHADPLPVYEPKVPVDKILEINAGDIEKFHIVIGDTVKFTN